jgi:mono/diheme cytochrome c family protein
MQPLRRCGRGIGVAAGLCLSLGATLLAQGPAAEEGVVGLKTTKKYHKPTCAVLKRAKAESKVELPSTVEAEARGFKPCELCRPQGAAKGDGASPDGGPSPGKGPAKRGPAKGKTGATARKGGTDDGGLKFSRDIAPILAANCADCHGGAQPKGQFNLTTFQGLLNGGKKGKEIVPGKPDESRLVQLVQAGEMPRGNNRKLSAEAIAKITSWVKAGARLDAGIDPAADLKSYAPTADDLRRAELAKLPPEQRDAKAREVALERWKKASSKTTPELTTDKHFLLFGNLPKKRAESTLKTLEAQLGALRGLLGPRAAALNGPEKISVYVFNDANAYAEFVRAIENREVEAGDEAHGRLDVETPYLAAADPLGGRDEPARKPGRSKGEDAAGAERSLAGLLTEQLATAATAAAGKPPRWLSLGLGAFFGSRVEPGSPYYRRLRSEAAEQLRIGWTAKANEALGGEGGTQRLRAMGLSLVEWLAALGGPMLRGVLGGLLDGQEKLDDVIKAGWGPSATRDQFIGVWGEYVASHYRMRRR